MRSRDHHGLGPLADAARELNALGDALRDHRLGAMEATALVEHVVRAIDVAVFVIDDRGVVKLSNGAADALVGAPCTGEDSIAIGLRALLETPQGHVETPSLPGARGPMEIRSREFRRGGKAHTLLVAADVARALREQEREAWRRLVRVLGHEINSSLAPIQSIAAMMTELLDKRPRPPDWEDDLRSGLAVVGRRSASLARFLVAYAQLAKLPPPKLARVEVAQLVDRVAALEQRVKVRVEPGPPATVVADADQLEQVLINLIRNGADAASPAGGGVSLTWRPGPLGIEIIVDDDGPGIANPDNLFVPFFTTKPDGSGIGLCLSRQIAEAHGGTLTLANKPDAPGARASLVIAAYRGADAHPM